MSRRTALFVSCSCLVGVRIFLSGVNLFGLCLETLGAARTFGVLVRLEWIYESCFVTDRVVGDIVMLVTLWWWLISDVGCKIIMFAIFFRYVDDFLNVLNWSPTFWIGHQHLKLVTKTFQTCHPTSVTNIDVTCATSNFSIRQKNFKTICSSFLKNKMKQKNLRIQKEKMEIDTDRTESDLGEFSN